MTKPKMSLVVREKMRKYIKNGKDISDLIKPYSLKGENLSRGIISNFSDRICDDLTGTNFSLCILGKEGTTTDVGGAIFQKCNFKRTRFLGKWMMRGCDFKYSSFVCAYIPHAQYQNADVRHCIFCNTMFVFGTNVARGAKISKELFTQLLEIYNADFEIEFKDKK